MKIYLIQDIIKSHNKIYSHVILGPSFFKKTKHNFIEFKVTPYPKISNSNFHTHFTPKTRHLSHNRD